jgi:hypothetical protein
VGAGFSPLDEELALPSGSLSAQAQEWLVRLCAWMPFAQAAHLLADMTGVQVSEATARRLAEAAGAVYVAQQTAAAAPLAPPADPGPEQAARLQVSVDGAMVGLKGGQWAEVKTLVIGEVPSPAPQAAMPHTTALSYFSRLTSSEEFARLSLVETHRRGLRAAAAVAGVVDGALWAQSFLDFHCSDAVRILDFPHALEHVAAIGQALWGDGSKAAAGWLRTQARRLKHTGPTGVLATIARLRTIYPQNSVLAEHGEYLRKRAAQLDYPAFLAAGWPIGSGAVESANKLVVEARLKGAGMRWAAQQVNPMLGLRNAVCNDRWAEAWAVMAQGLRGNAARRSAGRATASAAGALGEPGPDRAEMTAGLRRTEPGPAPAPAERPAGPRPPWRPGPNHPWRRSPIGKAYAA